MDCLEDRAPDDMAGYAWSDFFHGYATMERFRGTHMNADLTEQVAKT